MPEPITRTPVCTVKGCPAPSDPEWHVPICGHGLEGQHHHVVKRSQGGTDGMQVFICPKCHDKADNKPGYGNAVVVLPNGAETYCLWEFHSPDRVHATGYKMLVEKVITNGNLLGDSDCVPDPVGDGLEEREVSNGREVMPNEPMRSMSHEPLHLQQTNALRVEEGGNQSNPLTADWSGKSDDELTAIFQEAEKAKSGAFLVMCKCVWQYKERHHRTRGESWVEEAYERFHSSRRTLEGWAGFWEVCASLPDAYAEHVGTVSESRDLVQVIGRAEKAEKAPVLLEAAVDYIAEYGEPPSKAALLHKVGVEAGERVMVKRYTLAELRMLVEELTAEWDCIPTSVGFLDWLEEREK